MNEVSLDDVCGQAVALADKPEAVAGEIRNIEIVGIEYADGNDNGVAIPNARIVVRLRPEGTRTVLQESFPRLAYGNIKPEAVEGHLARFGDILKKVGALKVSEAVGKHLKAVKLHRDGRYLSIYPPLEDSVPAPVRRTAEEQATALIAG